VDGGFSLQISDMNRTIKSAYLIDFDLLDTDHPRSWLADQLLWCVYQTKTVVIGPLQLKLHALRRTSYLLRMFQMPVIRIGKAMQERCETVRFSDGNVGLTVGEDLKLGGVHIRGEIGMLVGGSRPM